MTEVVLYVDPEKITNRLFGSIPYRLFFRKGDTLTCTITGKKWSASEIATAWLENRNLESKNG